MKLKNIALLFIAISLQTTIAEESVVSLSNKEKALKAAKIAWHITEVVIPSLLILAPVIISNQTVTEMQKIGKEAMNNPMVSNKGASLFAYATLFTFANSIGHGCYGLYKELKPVTKLIINKLKQIKNKKVTALAS